jgi:hypothetical protein
LKKFFDKCKNPAENSDIYNEVENFDMFSKDVLMKKSVGELRAMLADDTLFPLDETADTEIIERICDVIEKKENVPGFILKAKSQKAWRDFKDKYITTEPEVLELELVEVKKVKKHNFAPIFTALTAAVIIILVVKIPETPPQTPASHIPMIEMIDHTEEDCNWMPDGFKLEASGKITYDDNSKKSYSIYTSGEKVFFVSSLTGFSDDINSPSKNQLEMFDIFKHAEIDDSNINNNNEITETFNIGTTQLIIYGDVTEEVIDKLAYAITIHNVN